MFSRLFGTKSPSPNPQELDATKDTPKPSWFAQLKNSLSKTRDKFTSGLANLFLGKKKIDQELINELETLLLSNDFGLNTTTKIINDLTDALARNELNDSAILQQKLIAILNDTLKTCSSNNIIDAEIIKAHTPYVMLIVGVNGAGKTTTIGKLAHYYKSLGLNVMLAAGDTFRAGAIDQLKIWGERTQIPVIAQQSGADSASVLFDALVAAKARNIDLLIADTAGRLQNQSHLMAELEKIVRVIKKQNPNAPHSTILVLDAGIGQNTVRQVEMFKQATGVSGLIMTKLDGTAKGGIVFSIAEQFKLPIHFIGIGEKIDDLETFSSTDFVKAFFDN